MSGIDPAPQAFSPAQIAADPILYFFHFAHLPDKLQKASRPFCGLAQHIVETLPRNAERSVALRKLLEAKDAAVRANVGPTKVASGMSEPEIGEARTIGNHDEDRDGPIPFQG